MATRWYRLGDIDATNGSRTITGNGTLWVSGSSIKPEPGDLFTVDFSKVYEIEAITSDSELLLYSNYDETTVTGSSYAIIRNASININTRIANMVTQALNQKQRMLNEFDTWLTEQVTDPVPIHDSLGNELLFKPLPILISELGERGESSTTHDISANYTILTSDLDSFTYTILNLSGGNYTITIPDHAVQFSRVIECIVSTSTTAPITINTTGAATLLGGPITIPAGTDGYVRLIVKGTGSTSKSWFANSGRYIGSSGHQPSFAAGTRYTDTHSIGQTTTQGAIDNHGTRLNAIEQGESFILHCRTQSDMEQMIRENTDKYAASGFVHYGKQLKTAAIAIINEGFGVSSGATGSSLQEQIAMGFRDTGTNTIGESKTEFARAHIAGFETYFDAASSTSSYGQRIKFPAAPRGYDVYDSTGDARGTGSPTLNLRTETDPKYNNVASSDNEAVARAFEGLVRNGDFRNGSSAWSGVTVTGGVGRVSTPLGTNVRGWSNAITVEANTDYVVTWNNLEVTTGFPTATAYISTNTTSSGRIVSGGFAAGSHEMRFNSGANTTVYFLNYAIGGSGAGYVDFDNVSVRKTTEEVVTDRVDMFGGEFFLEEITEVNDDVYPNGLIQTLKTGTVDGTTLSAGSRPITYYAQYDGDTTSRGNSWKWSTLTDAQKAQIAANESNNIFILDDGRLVQWRCRVRSFGGFGNGDWDAIDPDSSSRTVLWFGSSSTAVRPQGITDYQAPYSRTSGYINKHVSASDAGNGIYSLHPNFSSYAVNGVGYFHVWGQLERLNQGAAHPTLNEMGARNWNTTGTNRGAHWYNSAVIKPTSTSDAFYVVGGADNTTVGAVDLSGSVSSSQSGREDGRYFDAAYADGKGGILDDRLSAWCMDSPEEAAKIDAKVKNSTYRGKEKLARTRIFETSVNRSTASSYGRLGMSIADVDSIREALGMPTGASTQNLADYNIGAFAYFPSTGYTVNIHSLGHNGATNNSRFLVYLNPESPTLGYFETNTSVLLGNVSGDAVLRGSGNTSTANTAVLGNTGDTFYIIATQQTNVSVEGNFRLNDVVGNPARILQTQALAQGWYGYWCPLLPTSTSQRFPFQRKNLNTSSFNRTFTLNNGTSWTNNNLPFSSITNDTNATYPDANYVAVHNYIAEAYVTEQDKNRPLFNGYKGVGDVFQQMEARPQYGATLTESLINKVPTSGASNSRNGSSVLKVTELSSLVNDALYSVPNSVGETKHVPVSLGRPHHGANDAAVKSLMYQTADNGGLYLNYAYNELVYTAPTVNEVTTSPINVVKGEIYRVNNSSFVSHGKTIHISKTVSNFAINDMYLGGDGHFYYLGNPASRDADVRLATAASGWGDDSTIKIANGQTTDENLNGKVQLIGTNRLTKRYGYTRNQARAGVQTPNVDVATLPVISYYQALLPPSFKRSDTKK